MQINFHSFISIFFHSFENLTNIGSKNINKDSLCKHTTNKRTQWVSFICFPCCFWLFRISFVDNKKICTEKWCLLSATVVLKLIKLYGSSPSCRMDRYKFQHMQTEFIDCHKMGLEATNREKNVKRNTRRVTKSRTLFTKDTKNVVFLSLLPFVSKYSYYSAIGL